MRGTRHYRLLKAGDSLAYLGLAWLTWRLLDGEIHWKLALAAVGLSAAWLALTAARMNHLFKTYFDVLSRLEVVVPLGLGVGLEGAGTASSTGSGAGVRLSRLPLR